MKSLLFIPIILFLTACSGFDEKDVYGKWMVINAEVYNSTLSPGILESVRKKTSRNEYYFFDDNHFKLKTENSKSEGRWKLNEKTKLMRITHKSRYGRSLKEEYTIVSIDDGIMKLNYASPGDERIRIILRKEKDF